MLKISIITVCFNSAKYAKDTFDSILNQTYPEVEFIVIDGASTDGTLDIIKNFEQKFDGRM
ncbi:MAG: glycosyltransferase, partial [Bacteroidales bacterium]|nr:glycosyltransferase [Bacteroidales bacterium]